MGTAYRDQDISGPASISLAPPRNYSVNQEQTETPQLAPPTHSLHKLKPSKRGRKRTKPIQIQDDSTRKRAKLVCKPCHSRKVKCNYMDEQPCKHCVTLKLPDSCRVYERKKRSTPVPKLKAGQPMVILMTKMDPVKDSPDESTLSTNNIEIPAAKSGARNPTHMLHQEKQQKAPLQSMLKEERLDSLPVPTQSTIPDEVDSSSANDLLILNSIKLDPENHIYMKDRTTKEYVGGRNSSYMMDILLKEYMSSDQPKGRQQTEQPERRLEEVDIAVLKLNGCFNLPDENICWQYINNFFNNVFPCAPFIHRTEFLKAYKDFNNPPSLLLLQSILFLGAKSICLPADHEERHIHDIIVSTLYRRAKALYDVGIEADPIPLVQSLICLSWNFSGKSLNLKNHIHYVKISIATAQSFAFHRDNSLNTNLSDYERRMYKRIWWFLFIREQSISFGFGRPMCVSLDDDVNVSMVNRDDFDGDSVTNLEFDFFVNYVKIAIIIDNLFRHQAIINSLALKGLSYSHIIKQDDLLLSKWFEKLPAHLHFKIHDKSTQNIFSTTLNGYYYTLLLIVHRMNIMRRSDIDTSGAVSYKQPSEGEDYNPSWAITFQAAYMISIICETVMLKSTTRFSHPGIPLLLLHNASYMMLFHVSNKDKRISRVASQVVLSCLKMLKLNSEEYPFCNAVYWVIKQVYDSKENQKLLIKSIISGFNHENGATDVKRDEGTPGILTNNLQDRQCPLFEMIQGQTQQTGSDPTANVEPQTGLTAIKNGTQFETPLHEQSTKDDLDLKNFKPDKLFVNTMPVGEASFATLTVPQHLQPPQLPAQTPPFIPHPMVNNNTNTDNDIPKSVTASIQPLPLRPQSAPTASWDFDYLSPKQRTSISFLLSDFLSNSNGAGDVDLTNGAGCDSEGTDHQSSLLENSSGNGGPFVSFSSRSSYVESFKGGKSIVMEPILSMMDEINNNWQPSFDLA